MTRFSAAARSPVAIQVVLVLSASAILTLVTFVTFAWVDQRIARASNHAEGALLVSQIDGSVEATMRLLHDEGERLTRESSVLMPPDAALVIDDELRFQQDAGTDLSLLELGDETAELGIYAQRASQAFRTYARDRRPESLATVQAIMDEQDTLLDRIAPLYAAEARERHSTIRSILHWAEAGLLSVIGLGTIILGFSTWYMSRRMNQALRHVREEKVILTHTTQTMERRNGQFRALYQVVTEITDTLSMKYVVQTTIREAKRLVSADVTTLRLLHGDTLDVASEAIDDEQAQEGSGPVPLGTGLTGRAAKRGKTFVTATGASQQMAEAEMVEGMESGIVVPLIVGARVVGTMSCWSRRPGMFDLDDQQVLEMMASHVATAVAAADTHRETEQLAHTDTMTELPNRRQLAKDTQERFQVALDQGRALAVAMLDIDHFKLFNDEYGHKTGDVTLQKVASVLRASLRDEDFVYRYGGEEFTIVVEDATEEQALLRLERVRVAVERLPITGDSLQPVGPVTISAGIASSPPGEPVFETLLKLADAALYESKGNGRNRVTVWQPDSTPKDIAA